MRVAQQSIAVFSKEEQTGHIGFIGAAGNPEAVVCQFELLAACRASFRLRRVFAPLFLIMSMKAPNTEERYPVPEMDGLSFPDRIPGSPTNCRLHENPFTAPALSERA